MQNDREDDRETNETQRESARAWDDVAQQFRSLGKHLQERYRQQAPAGEGVNREVMDDAVRKLTDAVEQAVDSVGSAVKDPAFRTQAKNAAQAIVDAIGTTVSEFGADLKSYAPRYTPPGSSRKETSSSDAEKTPSDHTVAAAEDATASQADDEGEAVWEESPPESNGQQR